MAKVLTPFTINRTIGNLTFYQMEDRNFVRKKMAKQKTGASFSSI
jgi:hypothetical protein